MLRHDIRASLVYSCQACLHEWEIDPSEEPQLDQTGSGTSTAVHEPQSASKDSASHRGEDGNARRHA